MCREDKITQSLKFHEFSRLFDGVVTAFQFPARVITAVRPSFHGFTGANERKSPRTSELKKPR